MTTLDDLQIAFDTASTRVISTRQDYLQEKKNVTLAVEMLKRHKHLFYQAQKEWGKARREARIAKTRWKSYTTKCRQWVKKNPGKVLEKMQQ